MVAKILEFKRKDLDQVTSDEGAYNEIPRISYGEPETEGALLDAEPRYNTLTESVLPKKLMSTWSLYPPSDLPGTPLANALRNLNEALNYIDSALQALEHGEALAADNNIIQFQRILPELFCSRSIGDGFGMVINAMMIALRNECVTPLEERQIRAIRISLKHLGDKPLLSDGEAVNLLERLEVAGLETDLPELDFVADLQ